VVHLVSSFFHTLLPSLPTLYTGNRRLSVQDRPPRMNNTCWVKDRSEGGWALLSRQHLPRQSTQNRPGRLRGLQVGHLRLQGNRVYCVDGIREFIPNTPFWMMRPWECSRPSQPVSFLSSLLRSRKKACKLLSG